MEAIAQADTEEKQKRQAARSERPVSDGYIVSDAVIGRALTSGSNGQHSIERIVAFFQKEATGSAAASFMAKEFGKGGKGVNIAGQDYALWFSNEGFRIAPGRSAFGPGSTLVPWVKAAALVSNLLRDGMYATQDRIDDARNNEFRELAVTLWNLRRDFNERAEERGDLPSIKDAYEIPNYSESEVRIEGLLREFEIREKICTELWDFASADLHTYPLRRFKHSPDPFDLYHRIKAMNQIIKKFHVAEGFAPVTGKFVTEDEIDHMLAGGPRVSESKLEIYAYFMQGHNAKECADFLKKSYGDGGYCYTGYNEWHDSKGIRLSREDEFSEGNYDTASLNWNQAQKRVRAMIDNGRYLNEQERAYLPTYEKLILARKIYAFQYYNPNDPNRTYPHEWDFEAAKRDILPLLNAPEKSAALYEDMVKTMAAVSPDDRAYASMEPALKDMGAFVRGEYSLFTPLPEAVLEAERQQKQAAKEMKKEQRQNSQRAVGTVSRTSDAPGDRLAAAARALAKKSQTAAQEDQDGQFSMFSMPPAAQEPETAPEPEPLRPIAPPKKPVVVETILSPDLEAERQRQIAAEEEEAAARYDLGYGHLGNGLTVWNRLKEEHGDYMTVAHIAPDRTVTFYDQAMPEVVKAQIRKMALTAEMSISSTQDAPVFSVPPQVPEQEHTRQDAVPYNYEFEYRRLSVLKSDCEYFLGAGQRHIKHLSEGNIEAQIAKMRELYEAVPEKPEWLSAEDIDRYEAQMRAGAVTVTAPNYEATVTAEEAPLVARLLADREIDTARFVHDSGDVTFAFAETDRDAVESLIHKLRVETSKAVAATYQKDAPKKNGRTRPELNYRTFAKMFPEFINHEYRYISMRAGEAMMPLILEWIDTDVISVSHYHRQNGDLMCDPEMTFRVDREKGTLEPLTFRQDGFPQLYQEVYPEPGRWIPRLSRDLSRFAQQWFSNLAEQGYVKKEAVMEQDGKDVDVQFSPDGTVTAPQSEQAEQAARPADPVQLYREALAAINQLVRSGSLYYYLQGRDTDYDDAKDLLDNEIASYMEEIGPDNPDLFNAYASLPMFREWLAEDILERNYQDYSLDPRDAIERNMDSEEAPDWIRSSGIDPMQVMEHAPKEPKAEPKGGNPFVDMDASEYIPLNMELTIDGRRMVVNSVDYNVGTVLLQEIDPKLDNRFPAYRSGSVEFIRKYVEEAQRAISSEHAPERSEAASEKDNTEIPPTANPVPEATGTGASDTPEKPNTTVWHTPGGIEYKTGNVADYDFGGDSRGTIIIADVDQDYIHYIFPDLDQEPVRMFRDDFEKDLDSGGFTIADPARTVEINEKVKRVDYYAGDAPTSIVVVPEMTPNVEQYLNLKAQYPDRLIGVQVGDHMLFYGKDAEAAAPALGRNLITREIDGLGETSVTGYQGAWQAVLKKLLEHGHSVLLARPDQERGPDAPYEIIKNRDIADYIPLGMELTMDGRRMKIDSVDYNAGTVNLQDMDLKGWFPVFRSEPVSYVREFVEEVQSTEEYIAAEMAAQLRKDEAAEASVSAPEPLPEPEQVDIDGGKIVPPLEVRTKTVMLIRDKRIPYEIEIRTTSIGPERHNFHITDDNLGVGGEKTKYQYNVAAIRTLKQIEAEGRLATPEEQEILSRYVGWGGIARAFDPDDPKWTKEYAELKELLTPEEYNSARSTVLNAHYTSPTVIKAMYQAVENMNYKPGTVLEPSMGVGNFFGLLPDSMADAKLYGVELDDLTGRIARQLYQNADITVSGFEKTDQRDFYDLAVGNVPFGQYHVNDPAYNKLGFNIHNYFFAKALDQVRPGGIVAFVTSRYTMDAKDSAVRKYLAERADLLGAIRLPNNAFKANAGTEVVSDIIFLQKRDRPAINTPSWVSVGENDDGFTINQYFLDHPEMVLGTPTLESTQYGRQDYTVAPIDGADLSQQLAEAIQHITPPNRELLDLDAPEQDGETVESIPADSHVRNFSYTLYKGKLYFRENSRMNRVNMGKTQEERIKGMIAIRDCARNLIDLQMRNSGDDEIKAEQAKLNQLYDNYTKKYGLLSSRGNKLAFEQDSSYPLLCSLEVIDEEGRLERKADMFTKRTIQNRQAVTHVDTAVEALAVSIGEKACVDLGFMASLMGGSEKIPQIVEELKGIIFKDPTTGPFDFAEGGPNWSRGWQAADEYLSGNVRRKLYWARLAAEQHPEYAVNVEKLEQVQPKDLTASEISVRIGASWIDPEYYEQFMFELLQTPRRLQGKIKLLYSHSSGEWRVQNKSADSTDNVRAYTTYGTKRINAYEIFEDTLNQRDVRIFDKKWVEGKEVRVLNEKQTMIAQQKQEAMSEAFKDWIFKDPERREILCKKYNEMFNNIRPREYDGSHINFVGMTPEIGLRTHQQNAVAHVLYGKNTLLAHCVGAGKTFEMIAAAMESKRLGLCQKSLFVVPNHLTEQWGGDFLRLYPGAKVLVATKKDFEPARRKKFCARIATGDYDAIIIGHSQFEKIPLSPERQKAVIEDQIDEIIDAIRDAKENDGERYTIKQMEKTKKNLEARLEKLSAEGKKDSVVTFEELGVDRLFVDEAHGFKNLFLHTKMRNVAGIAQTDAQKSSDMFGKCRYMDELTGGRGVTFATGTPVSNSMVELYTMMRYLQFDTLEEIGHRHFDSWAATFGEKVTAMELKPEGTGFRSKTRFAKFYNLPELMSIWKEAADIQTADMLNLPTPEAEYITVTTEPSIFQQGMVAELGDRAEAVRGGQVDPSVDNMLAITNDGRKLALDQRLQNPLLPDDPDSKVNACVKNIFTEWQASADIRGTQLVFCDLSTPKGDGKFNVYDDIKGKLIAKGIPADEIAFIHDANTEAQKAELFAKVRRGQVRVLIGSTQKMGAGTNVQDRIVASHDLDCPWRPADLEQRAGRSLRQGNMNQKVKMFKYVTKGTFDAYNWGLVENKQKFIGQIMTSKSPARSAEDVDATALSYAEVKALATGDDRIREKMELDVQVAKLKMLKANHTSMQYEMQDKALKYYPQQMAETNLFIEALGKDLPIVQAHPVKDDAFTMTVMGQTYTERKEAGEAIIKACMLMSDPETPMDLGEYRGFPMQLHCDGSRFKVTMKQNLTYSAELADDPVGNVTRINNALEGMDEKIIQHETRLARLESELKNAQEEAERPFPKEDELRQKSERLAQLNRELEKPKTNSAEQAQDDDEEPEHEDGDTPAREPSPLSVVEGGKPSIRAAIRAYNPPAPVSPGLDKGQRREAAL